MNVLVSLILAAALVLGGGATAAAAQNDLPNQTLYPVKLMTENAQLALTGDPVAKANLLMEMSQTRVEEMAALANIGETIPAQVQLRLAEQVQQAIELSAGMEEPAMLRTLTQLRTNLQLQEQVMAQLQAQAEGETLQLLTQTRERLQIQLRLVDEGLADPQGFLYTMENQMQYGQDEEAIPEPNQQGEPGFQQNDESGQPTETPGNGGGNEAPGGQNPDAPQNGNGSNSSDNNSSPSGSNSGGQKGDQGGSGSGGSGSNK